MRRRGPVVGLVGTAVTAGSFLALLSVAADLDAITVNGETMPMGGLLDDLFTDVTDEVLVFAGETAEFRHVPYGGAGSGGSDQPLLWAVEITDYEEGDAFSVSASDGLGNTVYGPRPGADPVMIDTIDAPGAGADSLVFAVRNDGDRPFQATMMFVDDPAAVDIFGDPDSKLLAVLVPLAASVLAMLAGMTAMAAGAVIALVDWRKTRGRDRSYGGDWRERR